MEKTILIVVGTRPEALKLLPVYQALQRQQVQTILCATNQHKELLNDVFSSFNIFPDISLDVMKPGQTLDYLTATILQKVTEVLIATRPAMIIVQGDTTTAFAAALAAFYLKIPVAHVEAGLRTGNLYAPFPEEINRTFLSQISSLHFAPTPLNVLNLLKDGVRADRIFCVGNTIVDALSHMKKAIKSGEISLNQELVNLVQQYKNDKKAKKRLILLTTHRRESFDGGINNILNAVAHCAQKYPDLLFLFPVHPNPHVQDIINNSGIKNIKNIMCLPALSYQNLIFILSSVDLVMTDSGGIQEEAVSLGKSVLILRDDTERVEAVLEKMGVLVGTDKQKIIQALSDWYINPEKSPPRFVFGDGNTASRIVRLIRRHIS